MVISRARVIRAVLAWTLLTLAWAVFVGALAGQLRAQEPCPPGTHSVDRYGFLCLPGTGEAFGDVAGPPLHLRAGAVGVSHRRSDTATPRIILAHQKLASDAWVDRSKNKRGERCCDAGKDCHTIIPERVRHTPQGVTVTLDDGRTLFIPGPEIMPSEDGRYWLCYWGGQAKCFFAPYSGS